MSIFDGTVVVVITIASQ